MTAQTILPANSVRGGDLVTNSLRFNSGSTDSLSITMGTSSSRRIWSYSWWIKKSATTGSMNILGTGASNDQNHIQFESSPLTVRHYGSSNDIRVSTNAQYRDPSAWSHFLVAVDTTQGTAANRVKIYKDGVQETSLEEATYPGQNYDWDFFQDGGNTFIGKRGHDNGALLNGYLAEVVWLDGTQAAPTAFGEFDSDSGIWVPIDVSDLTFGDAGFYLQFKGSGTSQNSSGLGADTSGNDNHFAVTNLTALDQSTDTPNNNFATLNPLDVSLPSTFALSEGNLDGLMSGISSNAYARAYSNIQVASGKWYAECKITEEGDSGIIGVSARSGISYVDVSGTDYDWLGINAHDYRYYHDGTKMNNNSSSNYGTTWDGGDTIGIALDMDNLAVYFSLNGTFQASGDPTSGASRTNAAFNLTAVASTPNGVYKFGIGTQGGTDVQGQWNFGSPPYAISSGNSDANGHGNFEYAVPSGYFALCTKNLAGNS